MSKCPVCGSEPEETEASEQPQDRETKAKDDVLAELLELMDGSLGDKLKSISPDEDEQQ